MSMQPKDQIFARMYVIATLAGLLPILVAFQVFRISVVEGDALRERGKAQSTSWMTIPAMRGRIVDSAGRNLAVNVRRYTVGVDPTVAGFKNDESTMTARLAEWTGERRSDVARRIRNRASRQYALVVRNRELSAAVVAGLRGIPGVVIDESFSRRYNHGTTAAHVLGHVDPDLTGIAGLEMEYDEYLSGTPGRQVVRRTSRAVRYDAGLSVIDPVHGESIHLTIDLVRQEIMEQELERGVLTSGAKWGVAIAMDPSSGAVLGMASYPTYDPNRAGNYDIPLRRNHAIADLIEPGSTFKMVAAVAAIETGVVAIDDSIDTGTGVETRFGYELRDSHAIGKVPFGQIIQESSNIGMAQVAERIEKGRLYAYARNFGFDQPTWIDLPGEAVSRVKRPDSWSATTPGAMSRGYEIQVTPLQMLVAYSALANGGVLVNPHVVKERRDALGRVTWTADPDSVRRAFRKETADLLLPVFEAVVDSGTATQAHIEGVRVAGKTGTASKYIDGRYSSSKYRATFAGFFPAEDPQVAMIVIMDEPSSSIYGGAVSAPVFRSIAERWLSSFPEMAARMPGRLVVAVPDSLPGTPDVRAMPSSVAARTLQAYGYRTRVSDDGSGWAESSDTIPGDPVNPGARARVVAVVDGPAVMPDVRGLGARDAVSWVQRLGSKVRVQGSGTVVSQWPDPGANVPGEVRLVLK